MQNTARQTRENRTITVDFQHEATYFQLLGDGKAFVACVLAFLLALGLLRPHRDGRGTCAQDCAVVAGPTWSGHAWHDGRQSGPSRVALLPPASHSTTMLPTERS